MKKSKVYTRIAAVVLAAGTSRRFGSNKLLYILRGEPVLKRTTNALSKTNFWKKVAVTNGDDKLDSLLDEDIFRIINDRYREGIGTSIAAATRYLRKDVDAILFLLGDQPLVRPEDIERIVQEFLEMPDKVVAFSVSGSVRNPIIFPSTFFDELTRLSGDRGARDIALAHQDSLSLMEIDPAHLLDLDTINDVRAIEKYIEE